jgi:hypothetical protein
MASYRVCFLNEIPRNERLFRCCQRTIVIRAARSRERAVKAAKLRFARQEGIRDWKLHAAKIEVELINHDRDQQHDRVQPKAEPQRAGPPPGGHSSRRRK